MHASDTHTAACPSIKNSGKLVVQAELHEAKGDFALPNGTVTSWGKNIKNRRI
jgi:hypothetical protein